MTLPLKALREHTGQRSRRGSAFTFPRIVNAEKVTAEFKNGVLIVTLPKTAQAKAKARQIPIATK